LRSLTEKMLESSSTQSILMGAVETYHGGARRHGVLPKLPELPELKINPSIDKKRNQAIGS